MASEVDATLRIDALVAGGDGIARGDDGCVVFVARAAPGETVEVVYTETRRQWRRARITRIVHESPERRAASCPHYARCGGCQLQHVSYDAQLAAKAAIVSESLRRIGGIETAPPLVVASPLELGYRNRVTLLARPAGSGYVVGYHDIDDPSRLVDVDRCPLAEDPINAVLASLRAVWGQEPHLAPRGRELRLTLRANADGLVGLAVEGTGDPGRPEATLERVDGLTAMWLLGKAGRVVRSAGLKTLDERLGPHTVPLAGTAFVQVNRGAAALLDDYTRAQCGDVRGRRLVDAYCGFGLRTVDLSRSGAAVVGIERDRHAVKAATRLGSDARFVAGDVEDHLARELPADVVVLNPPRRGIARTVVEALREKAAARVVYVSCDPATLARDLRDLSSRYALESVRAFDLFPQTAHVETIATLVRRD